MILLTPQRVGVDERVCLGDERASRCMTERSRRLPCEPASARNARMFTAAVLAEAGLRSGAALLLVSELASNAVQHAHTEFTLSVRAEGDLIHVDVRDDQAPTAALKDLVGRRLQIDLTSGTGRGLAMLKSGALRFGLIDHHPVAGKTLWFEVPPEPQQQADVSAVAASVSLHHDDAAGSSGGALGS